jgi:hypothetical protein
MGEDVGELRQIVWDGTSGVPSVALEKIVQTLAIMAREGVDYGTAQNAWIPYFSGPDPLLDVPQSAVPSLLNGAEQALKTLAAHPIWLGQLQRNVMPIGPSVDETFAEAVGYVGSLAAPARTTRVPRRPFQQ